MNQPLSDRYHTDVSESLAYTRGIMSDNIPQPPHEFPSDETIRAEVAAFVGNEDLERIAQQVENLTDSVHEYVVALEGVKDQYRDPVANGLFFTHRCLNMALHNLRRGQKKIYGGPPDQDPSHET